MIEHGTSDYAYGMWGIVIFQTALFIWFLFSFAKPESKTDWRSLGLFSGFLVALFVEMYGFPLTIYLLLSWLGSRYPVPHPFSHENGHLLGIFFGIGKGHGSLLHILSNVLIFGGILVVAAGWKRIHEAKGGLVTEGPYAYVRHPQYSGFILVILGFLVQWPTFITLFMAPILIVRYVLLARKEERTMVKEFGESYLRYAETTPRFVPSLKEFLGYKSRLRVDKDERTLDSSEKFVRSSGEQGPGAALDVKDGTYE